MVDAEPQPSQKPLSPVENEQPRVVESQANASPPSKRQANEPPVFDQEAYVARFTPAFEQAGRRMEELTREAQMNPQAEKKRIAYSYVFGSFTNLFQSIGPVQKGDFMTWLFYGNHHLVGERNFGKAWSDFLQCHDIVLMPNDSEELGRISIEFSRKIQESGDRIDAELGTKNVSLDDPVFEVAQKTRNEDFGRAYEDFVYDLEQRLSPQAYSNIMALLEDLNVDNTQTVRY